MANCPKSRPQNQKRQHAEADFSQDPPSRPSKKFKPTKEHRSASNFPPSFYDSLSKVWLNRRALRELDGRIQFKYSACAQAQAQAPRPIRQLNRKHLQRLARHGGPEISDLRGYPEPTDVNLSHIMSSRRSSHFSRSSQSRQSKSAKPSGNSTSKTSITDTNKTRSTAYDNNFERYAINEKVFPEGYESSIQRGHQVIQSIGLSYNLPVIPLHDPKPNNCHANDSQNRPNVNPQKAVGSDCSTSITVLVGDDKHPFHPDEQQLCACSPVFLSILKSGFREAEERVVLLPEVEAETFRVFERWLSNVKKIRLSRSYL